MAPMARPVDGSFSAISREYQKLTYRFQTGRSFMKARIFTSGGGWYYPEGPNMNRAARGSK